MKRIDGGVTAPMGFRASGVHGGIKRSGALDLSLVYSTVPAVAAGVFTVNRVKAAPVLVSEKKLKVPTAQAIIANSGNANCCTGEQGLADAAKMTECAAAALGLSPDEVLVCSTGVIGRPMPMENICGAIPALVQSLDTLGSEAAADGICTTDTYPKQSAVEFELGAKTVRIGGIAKGAGMIQPNMATMLCFLTTDASIRADLCRKALAEAVEQTFNRITVDGDMSTNDTVFLLANEFAENKTICTQGKDYKIFLEGLKAVCRDLARMMIDDGEGGGRFLEVRIEGAKSAQAARQAAYQIANSPLVKTMVTGSNPNWGRIAASVGSAGVDFNPNKLDIFLGHYHKGEVSESLTLVYEKGEPVEHTRKELKDCFKQDSLIVEVHLHAGKAGHWVWTTGLTEEYIQINTRYGS
ncbi:MAG: bifunctional glutamate N-acetyltransferase/amino-acid acetyltransferase ArgJ [Candidatus Omnitrophica bacterium]|nr:bifunctional glutamate N-acetyltransferase/amino-acid acetyltransferase ArgJ [Candidatus Omnitrophota bacterium]